MRWPTDEVVDADPSLGSALCQLAMGLDALYRRTRSSTGESALASEGLVPLDLWRGDGLHLADWSAAAEAVSGLRARAGLVPEPVRRAFVEDTLLSLATLVAWQAGDTPPFRELASRLLGLAIEPLAPADLSAWRERARAARVAEDATTLLENELGPFIQATLVQARARAEQRIGALPPRALMRLELVHDVPYTAYCDYVSNTMRLNADQPFTRERLKLLILHEAYPGHDYHLAWRERDVRAGLQPADGLLVITNTPSSPLFEGIGDNGPFLLGWLEPSERAHFELAELRSAACVNACLLLHEQGEPAERVYEFLVEEALGQPAWARTRVRFMQDPLRAPFVFSYYFGYRAVADASAEWRGARCDFYQTLYGRMHSPRSLRLAVELASRRTSAA
jgi:hypothetical protein